MSILEGTVGDLNEEYMLSVEEYRQETPQSPPLYGVVLGLPEEFAEEIAGRRQRYCPNANKVIFPHITLRVPFTCQDARSLIEPLERVAREKLPVKVTAKGLGTFKGTGKNVLYVHVERTPELLELHKAVVEALDGVNEVLPYAADHQMDNWVPHITIAEGMSEEQLECLMKEFEGYDPNEQWESNEILLVRSQQAEDGSILWTTTRSFKHLDE